MVLQESWCRGPNNLPRARDGVKDSAALAGATAARPVARRSSSGCTPDTIQSAGAAVATAASSEALPWGQTMKQS